MSPSHWPLFFRLVAERSLQPGALLLDLGGVAQDADPAQAESAEFVALAASFPCLITAQHAHSLTEPLRQSLLGAGCRVLGDGELQRCDEVVRPAARAGALWLDGDWSSAPPAKPVGGQTASRTLALKLLQLVVADAETRDIEDVFRQDPTLSYHLLRVVNSLGMGAARQVSSFSQAIMLLGRQQLRRWLNLMLFAARSDDYRAPMLLARVSARARAMELLARLEGRDRAEQEMAFMAGMFSMLGLLFGLPLPELFAPLQVDAVLVGAVLRHEGQIGRLLRAVTLAEAGDAAGLAPLLEQMQLSTEQFNQATLEAHQWMLGIVREAQGASHA